MNVLNETEKEVEKSQEYLNKLESVIKIIDRRKNSILYPGIKVSASQSKNNQEGGYWFNNKKKSPFTKDSNQLDLSDSDDNLPVTNKNIHITHTIMCIRVRMQCRIVIERCTSRHIRINISAGRKDSLVDMSSVVRALMIITCSNISDCFILIIRIDINTRNVCTSAI